MTTKEQVNQTSRVSIAASQAGENSQTNGSEHTIEPSIFSRPDHQKKQQKKSIIVGPTIELAKQPSLSNGFLKSKLTQKSSPLNPT
jgi:hypothetical protein